MSLRPPVEHIGFTGTERGMTGYQRSMIRKDLESFRKKGALWFHHGDCVGSDEQAHEIALDLRYLVAIHPPSNSAKRAFCRGAAKLHPVKPYRQRNIDLVRESQVLLATPEGLEESYPRSATWLTILIAQNWITNAKAIHIYYPEENSNPVREYTALPKFSYETVPIPRVKIVNPPDHMPPRRRD